MSRGSPLVPTLLTLTLALPSAALDASGADFGTQPVALGAGARALGMGGAFSAVADDATAVTWNPAGLTQCERPELALSLGYYHSDSRTHDAGSPTSQALRPDHISGMLPFFALGCQQVVGLSWQRQFDFSRSFNSYSEFVDIPGDFASYETNTRESSGAMCSLGISYAIELRPGLSCGITLNRWDDAWTGASHQRTTATSHVISLLGLTGGMTITDDWNTVAESRVLSGTNVVLGGFWQATPALTFALVAKPSYHLRLEQSRQVVYHNDDGMGTVTDTHTVIDSTAEMRHPSSLTLGSAWRQNDCHTVSCDATVTRWRQYSLDDGTSFHSPVNGYLDSEDFPDLWTIRLGYEYVAILPRVIMVPRVGLLLEDLPAATQAPDTGTSVDQVGATRDRWWGATAGLSVCQRRLIWDLGAQVRYGHNVGAGQYAPPDQTVDLLITTARLGLTIQF